MRAPQEIPSLAVWVAIITGLLVCLLAVSPKSAVAEIFTTDEFGDLLVSSHWSTYEKDTLVTVANPFHSGEDQLAHIRIGELDSDQVTSFTICLSPGDVWTASITAGNDPETSDFIVLNPGSCDGDVASNGFTPPPTPYAAPLEIAANSGYIKVYRFPSRATPEGQSHAGFIEKRHMNFADNWLITPISADATPGIPLVRITFLAVLDTADMDAHSGIVSIFRLMLSLFSDHDRGEITLAFLQDLKDISVLSTSNNPLFLHCFIFPKPPPVRVPFSKFILHIFKIPIPRLLPNIGSISGLGGVVLRRTPILA